MKKFFLFLLLGAAVNVHAQEEKPKLKDLLYSGKLKNSAGVIRSTDDLSTKIDTSTKKEAIVEKTVVEIIPADSMKKTAAVQQPATLKYDTAVVAQQTANNAANNTVNKTADVVGTTTTDVVAGGAVVAAGSEVVTPPTTNAAPKSNTKLWKEYTDSLTTFLKAEAFSSKQVKKETYYMSFDYEIGTDGMVTVSTVTSTPSNNYLQAQVKQFLDNTPLKLNPVLDSSGQPKKTKRKQGYTVTKD